jgi:hypothetical protein
MSHQDPLAEQSTDLYSQEYLMRPKDVEEAQRKLMAMSQEVEFRKKLAETFGTKHGFEVLEWLLETMRLHQTAFTGNAYTNYNCALKDFAGMLHDLVVHANPVLAYRLIKARYERSRNTDLEVVRRLEEIIKEETYK